MSDHSSEPRRPRVRAEHEPGFPSWGERDPLKDRGRRRFLKQLAAGTGALLLGLPRLAHGQSISVDFSKLDGHPRPGPGADAGGSLARATALTAEDSAAFDDAFRDLDPDALADEAPALAEAADDESSLPAWIEENRALWVEPGYLVLLRWHRPEGDEAVVAALEGSADAISTFLGERVTSVDQLHNLDQLHPLEQALTAELAARVAPATIDVLHLDHDCTVVCAALNPSREYPERFEIMGDMAAPGWE